LQQVKKSKVSMVFENMFSLTAQLYSAVNVNEVFYPICKSRTKITFSFEGTEQNKI
jgi:hypothetical protein